MQQTFSGVYRLGCRVTDCPDPKEMACVTVKPDHITRCPHVICEEIPERDWTCDECGREFDRLAPFYRVPGPPRELETEEGAASLPDVAGGKAAPAYVQAKTLCELCFKRSGVRRLTC